MLNDGDRVRLIIPPNCSQCSYFSRVKAEQKVTASRYDCRRSRSPSYNMQSTVYAVLLCTLAAAVLAQQMIEEMPTADKRMRQFAFAKRGGARMFAFAKRSADESDPESEETVEEKRARFAFAKRSPYRQFAFAKRSFNRFAFAKRARFAFA